MFMVKVKGHWKRSQLGKKFYVNPYFRTFKVGSVRHVCIDCIEKPLELELIKDYEEAISEAKTEEELYDLCAELYAGEDIGMSETNVNMLIKKCDKRIKELK